MKKQMKDLIKYITIKGKKIAVSANLITMLGLGNVACATVQQAQPEKSFSIHKEASDPEREAEAKYNERLIKQSNKDREIDSSRLAFWWQIGSANVVIMARYNGDTQKLWDDIVDWLNGETNINPIYYTYEEDKKLKNLCEEQTGVKGYVTKNGKLSCPTNSKER